MIEGLLSSSISPGKPFTSYWWVTTMEPLWSPYEALMEPLWGPYEALMEPLRSPYEALMELSCMVFTWLSMVFKPCFSLRLSENGL